MKRTFALLALLLVATLTLSGCKKQCRCYKYNGIDIDYFTPDEVRAQGKTCYEMRYYSYLVTPRYSFCEWDY